MSKQVLVVDDSRSIREVLGSTLENEGYAITKCEDGEIAVDNVKKEHTQYDLIMTDINMPNRDGISLIAELRKLDEYKYTPILVLTTESQSEKKMEAKEAGATGWIVKPFEKEKLLTTIGRVLK